MASCSNRSSISRLQEYLAYRHLPLPIYSFSGVNISEVTSIQFLCVLKVLEHEFRAIDSTKKGAKEQCAKQAVDAIILLKNDETTIDIKSDDLLLPQTIGNYIGNLNEYAAKGGFPLPVYHDRSVQINITANNCTFVFSCSFLSFETEGTGYRKKDAKQNAAKEMMVLLKSTDRDALDIHKIKNKTPVIEFNDDYAVKDFIIRHLQRLGGVEEREENQSENEAEVISTLQNINLESSADLLNELHKYKLIYHVNYLTKSPYLVILRVPERKLTLMGYGDTKEFALCEAIKSTLRLLRDGCCFFYN